MGKSKEQEYKQLTREELNALAGEELPERAAMSLINANVAAPINAAVALNALSDHSTAIAQATQDAPITQSKNNSVATRKNPINCFTRSIHAPGFGRRRNQAGCAESKR